MKTNFVPVARGTGRSAGRHKLIPGASARAFPGAGGPPHRPVPLAPLRFALPEHYLLIAIVLCLLVTWRLEKNQSDINAEKRRQISSDAEAEADRLRSKAFASGMTRQSLQGWIHGVFTERPVRRWLRWACVNTEFRRRPTQRCAGLASTPSFAADLPNAALMPTPSFAADLPRASAASNLPPRQIANKKSTPERGFIQSVSPRNQRGKA
ncbi:hypothetical protein [Mixta calida]|uniref:hypothetical protein n=1 Tax=Mixta calida TaxID=665913 RepID=UPI0034D56F2B